MGRDFPLVRCWFLLYVRQWSITALNSYQIALTYFNWEGCITLHFKRDRFNEKIPSFDLFGHCQSRKILSKVENITEKPRKYYWRKGESGTLSVFRQTFRILFRSVDYFSVCSEVFGSLVSFSSSRTSLIDMWYHLANF